MDSGARDLRRGPLLAQRLFPNRDAHTGGLWKRRPDGYDSWVMSERDDWRREDDFVEEEQYLRSRLGTEGEKRPEPAARILIGTSGWSYRDWLGSFYAAGTRPEDYLRSYATSFATVEIDSTFYAVPKASVVEGWEEKSPADFIFSAKFPRDITHGASGLETGGDLTRLFLARMSLLKDKLGPLLLQFPPFFRAGRLEALRAFLEALPREFRYAVELRHAEWHKPEILDLLSGLNIAWAMGVGPDSPAVRPLTADFAYLRWLGDRQLEVFSQVQIERKDEIQVWAHWIEKQRRFLHAIYGYFNNHYAGHGPASARSLMAMLGLKPAAPPAERQGELFG